MNDKEGQMVPLSEINAVIRDMAGEWRKMLQRANLEGRSQDVKTLFAWIEAADHILDAINER